MCIFKMFSTLLSFTFVFSTNIIMFLHPSFENIFFVSSLYNFFFLHTGQLHQKYCIALTDNILFSHFARIERKEEITKKLSFISLCDSLVKKSLRNTCIFLVLTLLIFFDYFIYF